MGTEAAFHGIEEYMVHAIEYFNMLEKRQKIDKRRIYLASDEPAVLAEAREKYLIVYCFKLHDRNLRIGRNLFKKESLII